MQSAGVRRNGKLLDVYLLSNRDDTVYSARSWEDALDFCDCFDYQVVEGMR